MAFIPATNEKQYQVKYQHAKKNGDTFNAFIYLIKFKLNKYKENYLDNNKNHGCLSYNNN